MIESDDILIKTEHSEFSQMDNKFVDISIQSADVLRDYQYWLNW